MKRTKWLAPAFALALAASALFASHVPASLAQQGSLRKPSCGCYVCDKLLAVEFGYKREDCAGILAQDACGEELAKFPPLKSKAFCQEIKAKLKFTSFKDSCPVYAPYCGSEETSKSPSPSPLPTPTPTPGGTKQPPPESRSSGRR